MKFLHNNIYDEAFYKIQEIRSFPYVGKHYGKINEKSVLIFAHNIYCAPNKYESEIERTKSKLHYANSIEDYTYSNEDWTFTFRNFIKANIGLNTNYSKKSTEDIISKIDGFISSISYTNYINDIIPSNKANNILISPKLIQKSNEINLEIIAILNPTHIICWGKQVFNYLLSQREFKIITKSEGLKNIIDIKAKKGFAYAKVEYRGKEINILKVFHPSMPGFGTYSIETQQIFKWFYSIKLIS